MVGEDATVSFNYADLSTTSQPASSSVSEEPDKYTGEPDTDGWPSSCKLELASK